MVESFSKNEKEISVEYSLIPRLTPYKEIILQKGDTLVAFIGGELDLSDGQELFNLLSKVFPDNQILILPRDVELGVVKNE